MIKFITFESDLDVTKKGMRKATRAGYEGMAEEWHETFKPRHFKTNSGKIYGYSSRGGDERDFMSKRWRRSYQGRKFAKKKHVIPLVYSGTGRDMAMASNKVQGKPSGARAIVNAPVFNFKAKYSDVNMREELTSIAPDEIGPLAKQGEQEFLKVANQNMKKRIRKVLK